MDPNSQNPQGDSSAVNKLEQDLQNLKQETPVTPQQPAPVVEPLQPLPQVPEETPAPPVPSVPSPSPLEASAPVQDVPKKGSPLMIIAIVLALIAVLAVVAYVFGAKFFNPQPTPTPIAVVIPTPTLDPTVNWKTYINSQFGFSLKYPLVWKDVTDPLVVKEGNREFRLQTDKNEFVSGVVFDKNADISTDTAWSKNIQLNNNKSLLITYTDNLGPGSKGGTIDINVFKEVISTFKLMAATSSASPIASPTANPTSSPSATVTP